MCMMGRQASSIALDYSTTSSSGSMYCVSCHSKCSAFLCVGLLVSKTSAHEFQTDARRLYTVWTDAAAAVASSLISSRSTSLSLPMHQILYSGSASAGTGGPKPLTDEKISSGVQAGVASASASQPSSEDRVGADRRALVHSSQRVVISSSSKATALR
eukprot:COSAG02_NODE_1526_length_12092_cov_10.672392_10_plen_158_part_00